MKLNKTYLLLTALILSVEIVIALYIKEGFFRHTFGDYLVVILMYCCIKSFINTSEKLTSIGVLIFAYLIEFLQYLNIVNLLHLQDHHFFRIIIGTTFSILDLIAYTLGFITILIFEQNFYYRAKKMLD